MDRSQFLTLAHQVTLELIKRFEGCSLHPYLCPAGIPTIAFGATHYADGRSVRLSDPPVTQAQAEALLHFMVSRVYLPAVFKLCPNVDTPEQLAALVDFGFNLGTNALKGSTLRRRVNDGRWDLAKVELLKWVHAGGKVLRGLVTRRKVEASLF
jgi:lysozyme